MLSIGFIARFLQLSWKHEQNPGDRLTHTIKNRDAYGSFDTAYFQLTDLATGVRLRRVFPD